jgi:hypothetical protein
MVVLETILEKDEILSLVIFFPITGTGKRTLSNGSSQNSQQDDPNSRYSTRARTGTIKMRKYTNEGFFTDEDDNENMINKADTNSAKRSQNNGARSFGRAHGSQEPTAESEGESDSDTEIESPTLPTRSRTRSPVRSPVRSPARQSKRGRRLIKVESMNEDELSDTESDTESDTPKRSRKRVRGRKNKDRRKRIKRNSEPVKKKRKTRANTDSESKTEDDSKSEEGSSPEEEAEDDSITEDLNSDDHSPVTRSRASQGSQNTRGHYSESDSSPPGRLSRYENSSHESQHFVSGSRQGRRTRNQGKSTIKYTEDSGNSESDDTSAVTVSQRGRVRRPTARARAMYD